MPNQFHISQRLPGLRCDIDPTPADELLARRSRSPMRCRSFDIGLELDGVLIAYFQSVSGLESTTETVEYEHGSPTIHKRPGTTSWPDIKLSRGVTTDMKVLEWRRMVEDGKYTDARTDGSVILFDQSGVEKARWNFKAGWPSSYKGLDLSDSRDAATEELTIAHEGVERIR